MVRLHNNYEKVSVIIPTYNRQNYAIRQLNYWSETGVCVHVLDGSNESINESLYNKSNTNSDIDFGQKAASLEGYRKTNPWGGVLCP